MSTETILDEFERKITLPEYRTKSYAPDDIPDGLGEHILENYDSEVETDPPSIKTDGEWEFTNQGYAGRLTLPEDWSLQLEPKVDLQNIFGMMEYAYDLDSARFLEGAYDAVSIQEFFDKVASILAENVIKRSNQGFHKGYIEQEEESQFIRGKIDVQKTAQKPWKPEVHSKYRELTADIEDNRILLWTLFNTLNSESLSTDTLSVTNNTAVNTALSSKISLSAGSFETVIFDSVRTDRRGEYNSSTGEVTVDKSGFYLIQSTITFTVKDQDLITGRIRINGSIETFENTGASGGGNQHALEVQTTAELSDGDAVLVDARNNDSSTNIVGSVRRTFLTVVRIA